MEKKNKLKILISSCVIVIGICLLVLGISFNILMRHGWVLGGIFIIIGSILCVFGIIGLFIDELIKRIKQR